MAITVFTETASQIVALVFYNTFFFLNSCERQVVGICQLFNSLPLVLHKVHDNLSWIKIRILLLQREKELIKLPKYFNILRIHLWILFVILTFLFEFCFIFFTYLHIRVRCRVLNFNNLWTRHWLKTAFTRYQAFELVLERLKNIRS